MDERLRFIARLLEGEKMAPLCQEFGISRVTGYKIFNRYRGCGLGALYERSRRPYRHANKLPFQVERSILGVKREYLSWGTPKIRDKLIRLYPMSNRPQSARSTPCSIATAPSSAAAATRPKASNSPPRTSPTGSSVPTTRASSCSATGATAIP